MDAIALSIIGILGSLSIVLIAIALKESHKANRFEFRDGELLKALDIARKALHDEKGAHERTRKAKDEEIENKQEIIDAMTKDAKKPRPGFYTGKDSSPYQRPQK